MSASPHPPLVYAVHQGTGPFLFLVHGFLASSAQWLLNVRALGAVCRPVTVDLYGHGASPAPEAPDAYAPSAYVDAFEAVRTALGAERWLVCGYSLGGALTVRYALTHPERLFGHVFTNSMSAFADAAQSEQWAAGAEAAAASIRKGGLAAIERMPVHPKHARRLPPEVSSALARDAEALNPTGIANTVQVTTPDASVREVVSGNRVPALLACGRFEKRFQPHREFAAAQMPRLRVVDLNAGHAVNMQDAAGFNQAVCDFVRTVAGTGHRTVPN